MLSYEMFWDCTIDGLDFQYLLTHYNIYPWIKSGEELIRVIRLSNSRVIIAKISLVNIVGGARLNAIIISDSELLQDDLSIIRTTLEQCLSLNEDRRDLLLAAETDQVLSAALQVNRGIRGKRYAELFEAVCGSICAQNVDFRRLYGMMRLLAENIGPSLVVDECRYHAFPTPYEVSITPLELLKSCKLGYRAVRVMRSAEWLTDNVTLERETLRVMPLEQAVNSLCQIPGIGAYSAAIILRAYAGRTDIFQFDSFTCYILRRFYFDGREVGLNELKDFVYARWGEYAGVVAGLLTTNTQNWAALLGITDVRPSGAKS